ncbi:MAG: ATP-dependent DNA helicase RecG [Ignavibacteria bacterium]
MDIKFLKGIGEKRVLAFKKIGIENLEDFLNFTPRLYLQRVKIANLKQSLNLNVLIAGEVIDINYPKRNTQPTTVYVTDTTGVTQIPIFGKTEFRARQFRLKQKYLFWGKVEEGFVGSKYQFNYRDHLKIDDDDILIEQLLRYPLIPIYELPEVLKATWIRPLMLTRTVFAAFGRIVSSHPELLNNSIPSYYTEVLNLPTFKDATLRINFPLKIEDIEKSRKRLAFEELFYIQLLFALRKRRIKQETKYLELIKRKEDIYPKFVESLNFELTDAQKRVINEIYNDIISTRIMNRMLQGDVGSGKTVVAIFAILLMAENGYQTAFMCPTEILAVQHYNTVVTFIEKYNQLSGKSFKVSLIIGGQKTKEREQQLINIEKGNVQIVIGTHALIQDKVKFNKLGFVIIDEQHKFGVLQRAKLQEKGRKPDLLVMTATPIPRTLAHAYYGDLDVSIIDEMPANRKPVKTYLRGEESREQVYKFVKEELNKGRQAFIIYPLIDESEKLDLKSLEENYERLQNTVFNGYKIGIVHGRQPQAVKDEQMKAFKNHQLDVLVATTVVEVGIDIPNATVMIIEDAQQYGLSQLHQLRGRIGRGGEQSYCILIARNLEETSRERLTVFCNTNNGFLIAEKDMEIRGPGEFFGTRQSGVVSFSVTDLNRDKDILEKARSLAFHIVEKDPNLLDTEHKTIREYFVRNYKDAIKYINIS